MIHFYIDGYYLLSSCTGASSICFLYDVFCIPSYGPIDIIDINSCYFRYFCYSRYFCYFYYFCYFCYSCYAYLIFIRRLFRAYVIICSLLYYYDRSTLHYLPDGAGIYFVLNYLLYSFLFFLSERGLLFFKIAYPLAQKLR